MHTSLASLIDQTEELPLASLRRMLLRGVYKPSKGGKHM